MKEEDFKKISPVLFLLAGISFSVTITLFILLHNEIIENTSFLKDYVTYLAVTLVLTVWALLIKKL